MTEQEVLDKEKRRAEEAQRLLNNDLLKDVLDDIEKETLSKWEQTPPRDVEAREHLWHFYVVTKKFRNTLLSLIDTGEMAEIQIQRGVKEKVVNFFKG